MTSGTQPLVPERTKNFKLEVKRRYRRASYSRWEGWVSEAFSRLPDREHQCSASRITRRASSMARFPRSIQSFRSRCSAEASFSRFTTCNLRARRNPEQEGDGSTAKGVKLLPKLEGRVTRKEFANRRMMANGSGTVWKPDLGGTRKRLGGTLRPTARKIGLEFLRVTRPINIPVPPF